MKRYLALGDSYTIGHGVAEGERWPVQLAARLRDRGARLEAPDIIAVNGWTTDELAAGIQVANPQGPYDMVSLLIGVNNQYRGRNQEEYRQQFVGLLQQAVALAGGTPAHVMVLSIPDWSVTPFAAGEDQAKIAAEIDAFNAINREEAQKANAHYVDVTPNSRAAADHPALIAADGLHPSGKMYKAWAELTLPIAWQILNG